ncbi:MAG TPA: hypothetical protein PLT70_09575, partial [bacterium]|nr:hypothetical protein [bacterium]
MRKFLICSAVFLYFTDLFPSPLSETVGAMGTTNPFNSRVFAQGAEVTYFNPALLTLMERRFSLNFFYSYQNLDISLMDKPVGSDVIGDVDEGTGIYGATQQGTAPLETNLPFKTRPTADLDERGGHSTKDGEFYGALGLVFPLWEDYLALGFYGLIPIGNLMKQDSFFVDEREANFSNSLHYELYDDRMSSFNLSLALSGGYKYVFAGVGVTATAEAVINSTVFTPDAGKNENKIHADTTIKAKFTPHFGLVVKPWKFLNIGFTAHLPSKTGVDTKNKITFWYIDREKEAEINTNNLEVAYSYKPLSLSPSIALVDFEISKDLKLSAGFTAIWRQWSKYVNRYNEKPEDNIFWDSEMEIKDKEGNIQSIGGWAYEEIDRFKWKDSWEFIIGTAIEYKALKVGLDLGYYMTPVPDQKGRTNYVDNNKVNLAAGVSYAWKIKDMKLETGI